MVIDNEAADAMLNKCRPTVRARYLEIQAFAIQEWKKNEAICMEYLTGILNIMLDDLTKVLCWIFQSHHSH